MPSSLIVTIGFGKSSLASAGMQNHPHTKSKTSILVTNLALRQGTQARSICIAQRLGETIYSENSITFSGVKRREIRPCWTMASIVCGLAASSGTQIAMRGSRRRFFAFRRWPGVLMTIVASFSSRYHMVVNWELPSVLSVLNTAKWNARRNSFAQSESPLVIALYAFQTKLSRRYLIEQLDEPIGSRDHREVPCLNGAEGPVGLVAHGLDILGEPVASHCAGDVGRPLRRQWPGKDRRFADCAPRMPNETREQPLHLLSGQIISFQGRKVGSRPAPLMFGNLAQLVLTLALV